MSLLAINIRVVECQVAPASEGGDTVLEWWPHTRCDQCLRCPVVTGRDTDHGQGWVLELHRETVDGETGQAALEPGQDVGGQCCRQGHQITDSSHPQLLTQGQLTWTWHWHRHCLSVHMEDDLSSRPEHGHIVPGVHLHPLHAPGDTNSWAKVQEKHNKTIVKNNGHEVSLTIVSVAIVQQDAVLCLGFENYFNLKPEQGGVSETWISDVGASSKVGNLQTNILICKHTKYFARLKRKYSQTCVMTKIWAELLPLFPASLDRCLQRIQENTHRLAPCSGADTDHDHMDWAHRIHCSHNYLQQQYHCQY